MNLSDYILSLTLFYLALLPEMAYQLNLADNRLRIFADYC